MRPASKCCCCIPLRTGVLVIAGIVTFNCVAEIICCTIECVSRKDDEGTVWSKYGYWIISMIIVFFVLLGMVFVVWGVCKDNACFVEHGMSPLIGYGVFQVINGIMILVANDIEYAYVRLVFACILLPIWFYFYYIAKSYAKTLTPE